MAKPRTSISISVRRHFVDNFFFSHKNLFSKETRVIDIGGSKKKRGLFNIEHYSPQVVYVNINPESEAHIISDATAIPLPDASFDVVIMGEILEHLRDPRAALTEAFRLMAPHGKLIATIPFMAGVHGDPHDYGRYTPTFWKEVSEEIGFKNVEIEAQGTIFAVMALMVQHIFRAKKVSWSPVQNFLISFLMKLDRQTSAPLLLSWTTGYGLIFTK
jgi:SAM-dependent methyltransferase